MVRLRSMISDSESDSDDEYIMRRPRWIKERSEHFLNYDDMDFKIRFRLSKAAAYDLLLKIEDKLEFLSERSFGVWKRRFPALAVGLRVKLDKALTIIIATAVLHNISRQRGEPVPPDDPELVLAAPWDELLRSGQMERISNRPYRNRPQQLEPQASVWNSMPFFHCLLSCHLPVPQTAEVQTWALEAFLEYSLPNPLHQEQCFVVVLILLFSDKAAVGEIGPKRSKPQSLWHSPMNWELGPDSKSGLSCVRDSSFSLFSDDLFSLSVRFLMLIPRLQQSWNYLRHP
ncbi:hypothetical protein HW555_011296 [Spodoptera exigua]|uniref:DDE Tnp4 domain-containing protein n=1 Tax=Spodoptera exigua TaxID=7107 RepID=A0A835G7W4_SPOEX|nr:hypothetical protein HW555_011296 [Spodoptera exigua]